MTPRSTGTAGLVFTLTLFLSAGAAAQVEVAGDTVCVNASRALSVSTLTSDVSNALAALITCPESGPRAIAEFWSTGPHDRDVTASLAEVTGRLRDRRLHEAARRILLDTSENQNLRIAALAALATHGDPCFALYIRTEPTQAPGGSAYVMRGWRNDAQSRQGSEKLSEGILADVIDLLQGLAEAEPDTPTGKVAALAVTELRRSGGTRRC
jgi:hypothetical protein